MNNENRGFKKGSNYELGSFYTYAYAYPYNKSLL